MKFLHILLMLSIFVNIGNAQSELTQTIRGAVIEKSTMMPLPGANVIILDSDPVIGTSTDINGKFRIDNVPVGRVGVKVSYIGYNEYILTSLNLTSARELVIDVQLEEKVITGKEVVITATQDKTRPANEMATVSSRSFTVEESQRYAGSRNDVARMASNFAGVQGTDDSRNDIIVRGTSPNGIL